MGSPLLMANKKDSNISDMHKNVLTKNIREYPGLSKILPNVYFLIYLQK